MKKFLLLLLAPLMTISAYADDKLKISVDEKNERVGGSSHACLVVIIYDAKADEIEKEWKSKMKGYDAKVTSKDEIFADNALIREISENTCDVYARTEKGANENETRLIVGFLLGETWLSSSNGPSYKAAEKIVKDFATKMTKEAVAGSVKAEEKKLEKLQDEQDDLVKKNKDLNEDIVDYQDKIKKAEADIKTNEEEQSKKKAELEVQQKALEAIKARQSSIE